MSSVCSYSHQLQQLSSGYATWCALVHSVAVAVAVAAAAAAAVAAVAVAVAAAAAADELVPFVALLAERRSVLGLHLVLVPMPVPDPAREPGAEPAPAPGCEVAVCIHAVVLVPALLPLTDVPSHQLSDFDLEFALPVPCTFGRPYWALHRLVDLSFVGGMPDGVVGPGFEVEGETALAKAGQQAARAGVGNC